MLERIMHFSLPLDNTLDNISFSKASSSSKGLQAAIRECSYREAKLRYPSAKLYPCNSIDSLLERQA
jgi:hypothetical protein